MIESFSQAVLSESGPPVAVKDRINPLLPRPVKLSMHERRTEQSQSKFISDRFGAKLRQLRVSRNLSQTDMAIAFGIDRSFISDVERGRKSVGLPTLEVIAIGFEMTLADLLKGL